MSIGSAEGKAQPTLNVDNDNARDGKLDTWRWPVLCLYRCIDKVPISTVLCEN